MKQINIGINGFGRIGRTFFRLLQAHPNLNVVAINDLANTETLAHLLKYDSIHGVFPYSVTHTANTITVDHNKKVHISNQPLPENINWEKHQVDIVIEATGKFKTKEHLNAHLNNGAKKVILSVPPEDENIKMIVLGVNEHLLTAEDQIISNASCTTNNAAPMIKIINDLCGVEQAYITTIHSYTTDQSLHDQPHRDLRRARAAGQSIVPTTTGAAKALTKIFPELDGLIGGCGIRVPVANGSLTDITFNVKKETSIEEINKAFKEVSENSLKNILYYTEDPIVSIDVNNSCYSCTFDSLMTSVLGKMVKIIGWYDNETGYSSRLIDLIRLMQDKSYI
ncbi:type I glyceraldehyde-3-phosphate dehydrogenase [Cellulophaga baltica]|jgi:glyceraldehyde 3-phosphate dehydrogenase|uniref:Glyceraldehyde-3-phosphate dehydrogenase n=1 Tax=Cellulophaga baltica 18 TaxID=1348584 RepID=A0AAU8RDB7_9FLAO|nr:type I glyceraldehyde-3-phosphate dehydrogenase [Cellulophaga baltica]AIY13317.1 glyceraldehyde-3-phosphate dehydrogenase [Cellulophaga baltica NN016038]AIZ41675.1 glyceraldehyde-3-phosphate dehydrogenase [Cellulophaga baltica 18]MBA6316774.1 type I glyceraldehyde-3-phosphate dehydrogenase [Cellulophaga baltica]